MRQSLRKFRILIPGARSELIKCRALLKQLETAQRLDEQGKLDEKALLAIYKTLPPRLRLRAAAPSDDSLPETGKLVVELNKIVKKDS